MPAERFGLDASVAFEWFLPGGGPGGRYAEKILDRISAGELAPAVPDLWHYELGSVLTAAKRDRRMTAAKLRAAQIAIRGLQPKTLEIELDAASISASSKSSANYRRTCRRESQRGHVTVSKEYLQEPTICYWFQSFIWRAL